MELSYIIKKIEAGDPPESILLDGYDPDMLAAGQHTRMKIVEWYRRRLTHPVPQLGNYIEGANARPWVRGDLLAAEMVRHGEDVPETGAERQNVILRYLLEMSKKGTWGSTPEYFAAACMTGKTIHVRQNGPSGLFIINSVNGAEIPPVVLPQTPPMSQPEPATEALPEAEHEMPPSTMILVDKVDEVFAGAPKIDESAQKDAELWSDGEESESMESVSDSEEEEEEEDGSYNLFFRGNHYQALATRAQYMRLLSTYGLESVRNFRPL